MKNKPSKPVRYLWSLLGSCPVDGDGRIQTVFIVPGSKFSAGTDREIIWSWFEQTYNVSVVDLMFNTGDS